jgi:hypothetical protein
MATGYYDDDETVVLRLDPYEAETLNGWLAQIVEELDMSAENVKVLDGIMSALSYGLDGDDELSDEENEWMEKVTGLKTRQIFDITMDSKQ